MNIPCVEIDINGNINTVYTDEIDLYGIGTITNVRRASHVNFDNCKQKWMVIDAETGSILHENKNREDAINWEIEYFSNKIFQE